MSEQGKKPPHFTVGPGLSIDAAQLDEHVEVLDAWERLRARVQDDPSSALNFLLTKNSSLLGVDVSILDAEGMRAYVQEQLLAALDTPAGHPVAQELVELYDGGDANLRTALERRFPHPIMDTSFLPALVAEARRVVIKNTSAVKGDGEVIEI